MCEPAIILITGKNEMPVTIVHGIYAETNLGRIEIRFINSVNKTVICYLKDYTINIFSNDKDDDYEKIINIPHAGYRRKETIQLLLSKLIPDEVIELDKIRVMYPPITFERETQTLPIENLLIKSESKNEPEIPNVQTQIKKIETDIFEIKELILNNRKKVIEIFAGLAFLIFVTSIQELISSYR